MAAQPTPDQPPQVGRDAQVEWLPVDSLRRPVYQRRLSLPFARQIAREFDPDKLHPLHISRRWDGDYVMDGWHRVVAVRDELGWATTVPCLVYEGLTPEQEIAHYEAQDPRHRRPLKHIDSFKAAWHKGDDRAARILTVVRALGLDLDWEHTKRLGTIRAVDKLGGLYDTHGGSTLAETLRVLRDAWGGDPRAYNGEHLLGVGAFLVQFRAHPHLDRDELVARLRRNGIDLLARRSAEILMGLGRGPHSRSGGAFGRAIHEAYNYNRKTRALPPWQAGFLPEEARQARAAKAGQAAQATKQRRREASARRTGEREG